MLSVARLLLLIACDSCFQISKILIPDLVSKSFLFLGLLTSFNVFFGHL